MNSRALTSTVLTAGRKFSEANYSVGINSTAVSINQLDFDIWEYYLKPTNAEWFVMSLYVLVFLISIIGNCLTIAFILRRKHLRTTINYFMLNLALADIMVTIICLPPTLMVDFMESWLVGQFLCKFTPYLQMAVTSVSSLSLGAIAVNRWFVVCHPLKVARTRRSAKHALLTMTSIWLFSLITLCPIIFVTELTEDFPGYKELNLLKSCGEHWTTFLHQAVFHIYYVTVCYALPLMVMAIAYTNVFRKLSYTKIPGHVSRETNPIPKRRGQCHSCSSNSEHTHRGSTIGSEPNSPSKSNPSSPTAKKQDGASVGQEHVRNGIDLPMPREQESLFYTGAWKVKRDSEDYKKLYLQRNRNSSTFSKLITSRKTQRTYCRKCKIKRNLIQSRKRSGRIQVALVVVYFLCYSPAMVLDLIRRTSDLFTSVHRESTYFLFAIAHLLVYLNSALNPIIYNCFSVQFRKEFRLTFNCCFSSSSQRRNSVRSTAALRSLEDTKDRTSCDMML
uniref:orexin receptor type 2 isoform X1 n=1 Tax=Ciona intestinalis TaxID=7719 RepID=UPI00089DD44E|nr:orexin receptor type 2 isoform X1 [Ciona intestinalis]|eukprot:XP_018673071.1 orexin receptor type 2 isoform X1 [Ciona intestinalis]